MTQQRSRDAAASADEPDNLVLQARDVRFDWTKLPMHWIPGEPLATHTVNVLHLLLPEGERWFVRVFTEALPLITDERLKEDVLGFIGQEAVHAESHQGVLDHFLANGLDPRPYTRQIEWMFRKLLGDRPELTGNAARQYLIERVCAVAAIEHYTAFLGQWILDAHSLDAAGADPTMLDLLRWHGAEEVEHRNVAFDLYQHLDGGYLRRVWNLVVAGPMFIWLWIRGVRFLVKHDPTLRGTNFRARGRDLYSATRKGLLPSLRSMIGAAGRYLKPSHHPSQEHSTTQAVAYLASSPAAQAAAR
jgi:predicted metal-dependent hydrolase